MIKPLAIAAAGLLAFAPAALSKNNNNSGAQVGGPATLQWNGDLNRSCSLTAKKVGAVTLSPDRQWLQSASGGEAAVLDYSTQGSKSDTFTVKSTDSSVTRNDVEQLGSNANAQVLVSYGPGIGNGQYDQVYQNNKPTYLDNQRGASISGSGSLDVHVKTSAHKDSRGEVQFGEYVVKTTVVCLVK